MFRKLGSITLETAFNWCLELYKDIAALFLSAIIVGAILNGLFGK